jgi:hypothetical protein
VVVRVAFVMLTGPYPFGGDSSFLSIRIPCGSSRPGLLKGSAAEVSGQVPGTSLCITIGCRRQ